MKVKNEAGEEIEVLTAAEVEAKIAAEKEALQKSFEEKEAAGKAQLDAALADKAKLEADLAAASSAGGDSANFKVLKAQLDEKDRAIKILQENDRKNTELRMKDIESEILSSRVNGNVELEKKVRFHYENTLSGVKAETREQITNKMESAFKLAADVSTSFDVVGDANFRAGHNFGGGGANVGKQPLELNANQKALASKLGITEADIKKYGDRVK